MSEAGLRECRMWGGDEKADVELVVYPMCKNTVKTDRAKCPVDVNISLQ